jgi:hypothetical protein
MNETSRNSLSRLPDGPVSTPDESFNQIDVSRATAFRENARQRRPTTPPAIFKNESRQWRIGNLSSAASGVI